MREELKELKELTAKLGEARVDYLNTKEVFEGYLLFNYSVDPDDEDFYLELEEDEERSYLDVANTFYEKFGFVKEYADKLKTEHPRYGEKRVKNTLVDTVIESQGWDYEEDYEKAVYVVTTHLLYTEAGYFDVKAKEEVLTNVADEINAKTNAIGEQAVQSVKKVADGVKNVVRPYGEVAKGQLAEAKVYATGAVNKGTKKLIKVLEVLADKTDGDK